METLSCARERAREGLMPPWRTSADVAAVKKLAKDPQKSLCIEERVTPIISLALSRSLPPSPSIPLSLSPSLPLSFPPFLPSFLPPSLPPSLLLLMAKKKESTVKLIRN
jgi:hypothetical protein